MKMTRVFGAIAVAVLLSFSSLYGCGGGTEISGSGSVDGTWIANVFELTNDADPNDKIDIIAQGGTFTVTFNSNGTYSFLGTQPGEPDDADSGNFDQQNTTIVLDSSVDPANDTTVNYTLTGNGTILVLGDENVTFDFDGNGTEDPAELRVVLDKQ